MIFCFGGSLKTHTKFVRLESVRVGHIVTIILGSQVFFIRMKN